MVVDEPEVPCPWQTDCDHTKGGGIRLVVLMMGYRSIGPEMVICLLCGGCSKSCTFCMI